MLFAQKVRSIKEDVNVPPALSDLLRIPLESLEDLSGDLTAITLDPEVTQVTALTAKILSSMSKASESSASTSSSSVMSSAKDWFFTSKVLGTCDQLATCDQFPCDQLPLLLLLPT